MQTFDNWEDLTEAVQAKCKIVLEKDVLPVMTDIVKKHIASDIYGVYSPKEGAWVGGTTYKRRMSLLSSSNMYHELQDGGETLMVTSRATPSPAIKVGYSFHNRRPGAFLSLFEAGNFGFLNDTSAYHFPRPAITNAQAEIDKSSAISSAIQSGIDR